jgi:hypothetical protein
MKTIFAGLLTLFLSVNVNALPLWLWESGGQMRDVHLQDHSQTSPNPNPEREVAYTYWSADNAGFPANGIRLPDPTRESGLPAQSFWSEIGKTIDPGSRVYFGELKFWNWESLEGSNTIDLAADLYFPNYASGDHHRAFLSLLAEFDVADGGNTQLIKFTPTSAFDNFSLGGVNYNLTFDSICKVGAATEDCGSHQNWFSLDKIEGKFNIYAKLGTESITEVPEPSSLGILLTGFAALAAARRRKRE